MLTSSHQIRVRYAETDQMGYVYYGNYSTYFEVARVELFRSFGISYKAMEKSGIMMPVLEQHIKYIKPARYDDIITIKTTVEKEPSLRIIFHYEVFDEQDKLLTKASTTLVFVDVKTGKPKLPSESFQKIINEYF